MFLALSVSVSLCFCLSVCLPACLSFSVSVSLSLCVCLSVCLSPSLSLPVVTCSRQDVKIQLLSVFFLSFFSPCLCVNICTSFSLPPPPPPPPPPSLSVCLLLTGDLSWKRCATLIPLWVSRCGLGLSAPRVYPRTETESTTLPFDKSGRPA